MTGYGGEVVLGHVDQKIYKYFNKKEIDIEEYVWSDELKKIVPDSLKPFKEDFWYECDSLAHTNGVFLSTGSFIKIEKLNGELVFESELDPKELKNAGSIVRVIYESYADDLPKNNVVFLGHQFEKGTFFYCELNIKDEFDPKKLTFIAEDVENYLTLLKIEYNGEEYDGSDGYSTMGKGFTFCFIKSESTFDCKPHKIKSNKLTHWFSVETNPVHHGLYEIEFSNGRMGSVLANWNGHDWADYEENEKTYYKRDISRWRGLKKQST